MAVVHSWRHLALYVLVFSSRATSQSLNTVRVDDSNVYSASTPSGIQYGTTGWSTVNTGDSSQRYQGTYTKSQAFGSQLWFAFRGSSITYYADKAPGFGAVVISFDGGDNINVNWTNAGTSTLYQQNIWSIGGLDNSDHMIVFGNMNVDNASIGLDYFAVTPWNGANIAPEGRGPGASSVSAKAILIDNESNNISYSGSLWESYYTDANATTQAMYFNHTQHCAKNPGAVATTRFNGTALWYFSDDFSGNSQVQLSIDGGDPQTVDTATTGHNWSSQKLFWNISGLTPEYHTVTLTHAGSQGDYACVDFFMYLPSSESLVTPTPSPIPSPVASNSKSIPVGAIAGGAIGGVVLIALIIGLFIWLRCRSSRPPVDGPRHETYTGSASYQTKQIDPAYHANNLGPAPSFDQRPYSPYANVGEGASVANTAWTGPTYRGHPELQ